MTKGLKTKKSSPDDFYQKWVEVKAEIERLRNYYEVDFHTAFTRVRELKEIANYYWDQYDRSRSIEASNLSVEAQAIYQIWCSLRDLAKELQSQVDASDDDAERSRLKSILCRIQDRADDLWFDLKRVD
ncbi:MAG: hypothetical protein ACOH5I_10565 [Oligoflexus sp.]